MNQNEETATVVYSFPRGENEKIQFALRPYKGRYYIDLRLWFQGAPDSPYTPTKKGVSFSSDCIAELKEGVRHLDLACQGLKPPAEPAPRPESRSKTQQGSYPQRQTTPWSQRNRG